MLEHDALSQLVYRLRHFNEAVPEEAEAVQKLLSVFENMIEVKPAVAEQLVQLGDNKTGFLRYVTHLKCFNSPSPQNIPPFCLHHHKTLCDRTLCEHLL